MRQPLSAEFKDNNEQAGSAVMCVGKIYTACVTAVCAYLVYMRGYCRLPCEQCLPDYWRVCVCVCKRHASSEDERYADLPMLWSGCVRVAYVNCPRFHVYCCVCGTVVNICVLPGMLSYFCDRFEVIHVAVENGNIAIAIFIELIYLVTTHKLLYD